MKIFKKLSALCLVLLATFTLSIATPAVSFAKAPAKAHTTVRTTAKKATHKAKLTAAKRAAAKARLTAAKRAAAKTRLTAAKRTTAKARLTAAKRTTAKARLTAAKRTAAKARLTAVKTGARAKVTAKALNVRKGPAKTYKKVGTLRKGAVVKVVASKAGWKKVQYGTRTGYVSSKYLK